MDAVFQQKRYPIRIWSGEKVRGDYLTVDTETLNIDEETREVPDLVLLQVFDGHTCWLADWKNGRGLVDQFQGQSLIMHNAPFDIAVMAKAFQWSCIPHVESETLWDTGVLFRLQDLYYRGTVGQWALDFICQTLLRETISKDSSVRMGWTRDRRCWEWGEDRLIYGATDVVATRACFDAMKWILQEKNALTHNIQLKGEIALDRVSRRGMGFDLEARENLLHELDKEIDDLKDVLFEFSWIPGLKPKKGQKGPQAIEQAILAQIEEDYQVKLPRSGKKKLISTKRENLEEFSDDRFVGAFLQYKAQAKFRTFVENIDKTHIHPRYTGILRTGRTSCSSPNIQQLPRRPGVRECFIPSEGNVFVIADFSMLELVTLAQTTYSMYGYSQMREILNQGKDLHRWFASQMYGVPEEAVTKDQRQSAKACNFGYPGGLGAKKFVSFAKGYGLTYTVEEAQRLKELWIKAFPEMGPWFEDTIPKRFDWSTCPIEEEIQKAITTRILRGQYTSNKGKNYPQHYYTWVHKNIICAADPWFASTEYDPEKHFLKVWSEPTWTITGRRRARSSYNASRNTRFQGLGGDALKCAMWEAEKKGLRIVAEIHDELIVEAPVEKAEEHLRLLEKCMLEGLRQICPDVRAGVEGSIKERWSK